VEPLKTHIQATIHYQPFQALPRIIFWRPTVKSTSAPTQDRGPAGGGDLLAALGVRAW